MQERYEKLNKTVKLFTALKFVGLGLLILGAILFIVDMVQYVNLLSDAFNAGDETLIVESYVTFVLEGTGSMTLLIVGLAALIVFSILSKKKKAQLALLKTSINSANQQA